MTFLANMRTLTIFLTSILVVGLFPFAVSGQARTFTDKSIDYVIEFPSSEWRAVGPSGIVPARTRSEFIHTGGDVVRLLVRKKLVDSSVTPSDMVRLRQARERHLPGYVMGKEESFDGLLSGTEFSYEYTRGGTPMTALVYYLEADNRTIYSLLFIGTRDEVQSLAGQADSIARSFHLR